MNFNKFISKEEIQQNLKKLTSLEFEELKKEHNIGEQINTLLASKLLVDIIFSPIERKYFPLLMQINKHKKAKFLLNGTEVEIKTSEVMDLIIYFTDYILENLEEFKKENHLIKNKIHPFPLVLTNPEQFKDTVETIFFSLDIFYTILAYLEVEVLPIKA